MVTDPCTDMYDECQAPCLENPAEHAICKCVLTGNGGECVSCPPNHGFYGDTDYCDNGPITYCNDETAVINCASECTDATMYGDCKCIGTSSGEECVHCPPGFKFSDHYPGACVPDIVLGECDDETEINSCNYNCNQFPEQYGDCKCVYWDTTTTCITCPPNQMVNDYGFCVPVPSDCSPIKKQECADICLQDPIEYGDCKCLNDGIQFLEECFTCSAGHIFDDPATTSCIESEGNDCMSHDECMMPCAEQPDTYGECRCIPTNDCDCNECIRCAPGESLDDNNNCFTPCTQAMEESCQNTCMQDPQQFVICMCFVDSGTETCASCTHGQIFDTESSGCIDIPLPETCGEADPLCQDPCVMNPAQHSVCKCLEDESGAQCHSCPPGFVFTSPESGDCEEFNPIECRGDMCGCPTAAECGQPCLDMPEQFESCNCVATAECECGECIQCQQGRYLNL